jgi:hypothetical protein
LVSAVIYLRSVTHALPLYSGTHATLGNDVVRIGFAEARALQKVHDIRFADTLFIRVIEYNFDCERC